MENSHLHLAAWGSAGGGPRLAQVSFCAWPLGIWVGVGHPLGILWALFGEDIWERKGLWERSLTFGKEKAQERWVVYNVSSTLTVTDL